MTETETRQERATERALKRANDAFYKARKSSMKKMRNEKRVKKLDRLEEYKLVEALNGSY